MGSHPLSEWKRLLWHFHLLRLFVWNEKRTYRNKNFWITDNIRRMIGSWVWENVCVCVCMSEGKNTWQNYVNLSLDTSKDRHANTHLQNIRFEIQPTCFLIVVVAADAWLRPNFSYKQQNPCTLFPFRSSKIVSHHRIISTLWIYYYYYLFLVAVWQLLCCLVEWSLLQYHVIS